MSPVRDLAIAMHQDDERFLGFVLHDERLHDGVLLDAELLGRDARSAVCLVVVRVLGERDLVLLQERGGWCLGNVTHTPILVGS